MKIRDLISHVLKFFMLCVNCIPCQGDDVINGKGQRGHSLNQLLCNSPIRPNFCAAQICGSGFCPNLRGGDSITPPRRLALGAKRRGPKLGLRGTRLPKRRGCRGAIAPHRGCGGAAPTVPSNLREFCSRHMSSYSASSFQYSANTFDAMWRFIVKQLDFLTEREQSKTYKFLIWSAPTMDWRREAWLFAQALYEERMRWRERRRLAQFRPQSYYDWLSQKGLPPWDKGGKRWFPDPGYGL